MRFFEQIVHSIATTSSGTNDHATPDPHRASAKRVSTPQPLPRRRATLPGRTTTSINPPIRLRNALNLRKPNRRHIKAREQMLHGAERNPHGVDRAAGAASSQDGRVVGHGALVEEHEVRRAADVLRDVLGALVGEGRGGLLDGR